MNFRTVCHLCPIVFFSFYCVFHIYPNFFVFCLSHSPQYMKCDMLNKEIRRRGSGETKQNSTREVFVFSMVLCPSLLLSRSVFMFCKHSVQLSSNSRNMKNDVLRVRFHLCTQTHTHTSCDEGGFSQNLVLLRVKRGEKGGEDHRKSGGTPLTPVRASNASNAR